MQEHQQRGIAPLGREPAVFQALGAARHVQVDPAGVLVGLVGGGGHHGVTCSSWRRRKRWILPVAVLGSSSVKSIWRGYLKGARCCFT